MRTKTEEKRQAILRVAAAAFSELGFERTSMSEICARLGGSKATLYNYFASKETLFLEVMSQAAQANFAHTLQLTDGDVASSLRSFGRRSLKLLYSYDAIAARRLLAAEGARANIAQHYFAQGPSRSHAGVAAFLEQSMANGLLRNACTELAAQQLHALLEAELLGRFFFQHAPLPDSQEIEECTERAVEAFLRLYAPEIAPP